MNGSFPVLPTVTFQQTGPPQAEHCHTLSHVQWVTPVSASHPQPALTGTRQVALQLGGASSPATGSGQDTSLGTRQLLQPLRKDALPLAPLLGPLQKQILLGSFPEKKINWSHKVIFSPFPPCHQEEVSADIIF